MGQCVSQQPAFERVQVVVTEEEPRQRKFQSASLGRKSSRKHSIASLLPNGKGKTRRRKDDELSAAFNMSAVEFKVHQLFTLLGNLSWLFKCILVYSRDLLFIVR